MRDMSGSGPSAMEILRIHGVKSKDGGDMGGGSDDGLDQCVSDLMDAIKNGDHDAVKRAWMSGFQIMESMPHDEGDGDDGADENYARGGMTRPMQPKAGMPGVSRMGMRR